MTKHLGVDINCKESNVDELIDKLMSRAKTLFPGSRVTHHVVTHKYGTMLRIKHGQAIKRKNSNNKETWVAVVPITTRWRSEDGKYYVVRPGLLPDVMEHYHKLITEAVNLGVLDGNIR